MERTLRRDRRHQERDRSDPAHSHGKSAHEAVDGSHLIRHRTRIEISRVSILDFPEIHRQSGHEIYHVRSLFRVQTAVIELVIRPREQCIRDIRGSRIAGTSGQKLLEGAHLFFVDTDYRIHVCIPVDGGPEGLSHRVFRSEKFSGTLLLYHHIFLSSKDISFV